VSGATSFKEIDYVFRRLKNEEILSSVIKYENKINISFKLSHNLVNIVILFI
jgi:hypothetical protein